MRPPRFAVVGTGRCGTGYVAAVMRACGVRCGHENWWTPEASRRQSGLDGDSSWLALPDIEAGRWSGPVVHVVRNPVDVVASLLGIGIFARPTAYRAFALWHEPDLSELPPLAAAVAWWQRWNDRCAVVADVTVRVERLPEELDQVATAIGRELDPEAWPPADVNHRRRAAVDPAQVWRRIERGYGYKEDDRG